MFRKWLESLYHPEINPSGHSFGDFTTKNRNDLLIMADYIEEHGHSEPYNVGILCKSIAKVFQLFLNSLRTQYRRQQNDFPPFEGGELGMGIIYYVAEASTNLGRLSESLIKLNNDPGKAKILFQDRHRDITHLLGLIQENRIPRRLQKVIEFAQITEQIMSRMRNVTINHWGEHGEVSENKWEPANNDPVRVFDSALIGGKVKYLDGKLYQPGGKHWGKHWFVRYTDGRNEQLTGVSYGDREKLTWNRIAKRWEFR